MIEKLKGWDQDLFLYLNDLHAPWLDQPMYILSNTMSWLPLYVLLFFVIVKDFKKQSVFLFVGIALTVALSDQITSGLMKPFFERLRPSRDPELEGLVHYVNDYKGGLYGFASSHAANTFGVAAFVYMLYRSRRRVMALLFIWAFFVSYSRIYLGVHYPGDLIAGAMVGILCGTFCYGGAAFLMRKYALDHVPS